MSQDPKGQEWDSESESVEGIGADGGVAGGGSAITAGPGRQTTEAQGAGSPGGGC